MRTVCTLMLLGILIVLAQTCQAAEALERFRSVMAGTDYHAKRQAVQSLAGVQDDDAVYTALISALGDRQAKEAAVSALRRRSGLQPARSRGGNTGYPGYPAADTAAAWSTWNRARLQELQTQAATEQARALAVEAKAEAAAAAAGDEAEESGDEAEGDAGDAEGVAADGEQTEEVAAVPRASVPDERLGPPDRIFFHDGSILIGHVTVQRRDLTGKLTSVHVVHSGGGGEEDIDAALISRIEEDIAP